MALPLRDDRLGWVAADVAGSPAAAAQFAAAGTTHSSHEGSSTEGQGVERQDPSVTELHMQARVPPHCKTPMLERVCQNSTVSRILRRAPW